MPRGSRRSMSPMRAPPARRPPPPPPPPAAAPKGPGLFGQMAATAGGVAIGSAVGHTIGNMMSGGGGGGSEVAQEQAPYQQQPIQQQQQPMQQPCEFELRQFLECSQNQGDVSICQGFSDALKDCRTRYGV